MTNKLTGEKYICQPAIEATDSKIKELNKFAEYNNTTTTILRPLYRSTHQRCLRTLLVNYGILLCLYIVCNFGQDWEVGYLTGVHTQYKALLPKEITATVGVHIGLRSVNITLLGQHV